jgi:hypothetical protein
MFVEDYVIHGKMTDESWNQKDFEKKKLPRSKQSIILEFAWSDWEKQ